MSREIRMYDCLCESSGPEVNKWATKAITMIVIRALRTELRFECYVCKNVFRRQMGNPKRYNGGSNLKHRNFHGADRHEKEHGGAQAQHDRDQVEHRPKEIQGFVFLGSLYRSQSNTDGDNEKNQR